MAVSVPPELVALWAKYSQETQWALLAAREAILALATDELTEIPDGDARITRRCLVCDAAFLTRRRRPGTCCSAACFGKVRRAKRAGP